MIYEQGHPGPASPMLNPIGRRYGIHIADGGIAELTRKLLDHRTDLVALGVAILFGALLFVLTGTWPDTPDGLLHLHRVRALADALQSGVIYPRWFPDFAFGYGYPVFNYYAPGFYYPPALLHLAGLDVLVSVRITLALSFTLSGWWMFYLLRKYLSFWPASRRSCGYRSSHTMGCRAWTAEIFPGIQGLLKLL